MTARDLNQKIVLIPSGTASLFLAPRLRRLFDALGSIGPDSPFTLVRKDRDGNDRFRWRDAGIMITCRTALGCIHPTAGSITHVDDGHLLRLELWRFHDLTLPHEEPNAPVMEFARAHSILSEDAMAALHEEGRSHKSILARSIFNAIASHPQADLESRSRAKKKNGLPANFWMSSDPSSPCIFGNPTDLDDTDLPDAIRNLPRFAYWDSTRSDDDRHQNAQLCKDLSLPRQAFDPIEALCDLPRLERIGHVFERDLGEPRP